MNAKNTNVTIKGWAVKPVAALASGVLAATAAAGLGIAIATPAYADEPAADQHAARFEADFLVDMIDHHAMAVIMAEMCVDKAVHPELVATCESIVASQSAQIEQMQAWLEDWYGISHAPEPTMAGMQRLERLEGEEFEVAFMREMIRHHWKAIREAERCLDEAEHGELLNLCEEIRSVQLAEIAQMQTWLEQWYAVPGGRPVTTA
jgi:uncharacterized protein (DUF305 family)